MIPPPPRSTLFPYTTLFRSLSQTKVPEPDLLQLPERLSEFLFTREEPDRLVHGEIQDFVDTLPRSEEHTSELQSRLHLVCRLLLEKKNKTTILQYKPTSNTT